MPTKLPNNNICGHCQQPVKYQWSARACMYIKYEPSKSTKPNEWLSHKCNPIPEPQVKVVKVHPAMIDSYLQCH
jgi:hypothetical protein